MDPLARWERWARVLAAAPRLEEHREAQRSAMRSLHIPKPGDKLPEITQEQRRCEHAVLINKGNGAGKWKYCQSCLLRTTYMPSAWAVATAIYHMEQSRQPRRRGGRTSMTLREAMEANMEQKAGGQVTYEGVPPGAGDMMRTTEALARMETMLLQSAQHLEMMQAHQAQSVMQQAQLSQDQARRMAAMQTQQAELGIDMQALQVQHQMRLEALLSQPHGA